MITERITINYDGFYPKKVTKMYFLGILIYIKYEDFNPKKSA